MGTWLENYLLIENAIQGTRIDDLEEDLEETRRWQQYDVQRTPPQRIIIELLTEQYQDFESEKTLGKFTLAGTLIAIAGSIYFALETPLLFVLTGLFIFLALFAFFRILKRFTPQPSYCLQMAAIKLNKMAGAGEIDGDAAKREIIRALLFLTADPNAPLPTQKPETPQQPLALQTPAPQDPTGAKVWKPEKS